MKKVASLTAGTLALVFSMAFGSVDKELTRLNGTVEIRHIAETEWGTVFSSQAVEDTDWIRTQEASLARLDFNGGKDSATIYERTVVQIDNVDPEKVSLRQWIGKVQVVVRHLFEKPIPVEVTTPTAVMAVRGSEANCLVLPDGTTQVMGISGHIDVSALGKTISITGGQAVIVHPGNVPELMKGLQSVNPAKTQARPKAASTSSKSNASQSANGQPANATMPQINRSGISNAPVPPTLNNQTGMPNPNGQWMPGAPLPGNNYANFGGPAGAPNTQMNPGVPNGGLVSGAPSGQMMMPLVNTGMGPQFSGPPPGTTMVFGSNGVTYTYNLPAGMAPLANIPPGAIATPNSQGGTTYTLTINSISVLGNSAANNPVNPALVGLNGNMMPVGTTAVVGPNGTTYTYVRMPGMPPPQQIPAGVTATAIGGGGIRYTNTVPQGGQAPTGSSSH